jgi:hypothetical protein
VGLRCGGGGEGCGDGPRLAPFRLGRALGGVAGVWEARESGAWCRRFSAEPEGEHMRTSGLLGAGGGGAAGARAGAAGWAKLGAGAEAVRSRIQAVQTSCARRQSAAPSPFCRRAAAGEFRLLTPFGVLRCACSAAAGACVRSTLATRLLRARFTLGELGFRRAFLLCSREAPCTLIAMRPGIRSDATVNAHPEPMAARQEHVELMCGSAR